MEGRLVPDSIKKLIDAKNEVLKGKDEIIIELREKANVLRENIKLLEEKIYFLHKSNQNLGESNIEVGNTDKRSYSTSVKTKTQNQATSVTPVTLASKRDSHSVSNLKITNMDVNNSKTEAPIIPITPGQVNTAILQATMTTAMKEIQNLGQDLPDKSVAHSEWQQVRRRSRRFLVGGNEDCSQIQAVPKYVALHVTRLAPGTKPEHLKAFLEPNFQDVQCEEHPSKRPDYYSSMKVTIKQEDFKCAWKREVWPAGAIVSKFFNKKRMLP
nr:unnamed protein product [Callosobruchus analis]